MVGSLRPRKSVDYSKAPTAGAPTWLKLSHEDTEKDAAQKDVAGLEKENAKPASAERMARKAAAAQKVDLAILEQEKGKGRPPLARKDEGDHVTAKLSAEKKGKASRTAAPTTDASDEGNTSKEVKNRGKKVSSATEGQAADGAHNSEPKQRIKARKSAPAPLPADERPQVQESKRKSAPGQHTTKRPLPEASQDAKPAAKVAKRVKPSRSDAAIAETKAEAPADPKSTREASNLAAAQPADSWETQKTAPRASGGTQAKQQAESQPRKTRQAEAHQASEQQHRPAEQRAEKHVTSRPANKSELAPLPPPVKATDAAATAAAEPDNFRKLQEEYAALQSKYQDLKKQRIQELESMIGEQSNKAKEHCKSAMELAKHWKKEAERQANFAKEAGSAQVREALERLTQQNETLRAQLLEAESALLAEQEAVADLKQALAAAECRHATPLKADQAVQVSPSRLRMQAHEGAQASCVSAYAHPSAAAMKSPSSRVGPPPSPEGIHLQEARAFCPEGASLSDVYNQPAHVPGASAAATSFASPISKSCPSAKPLVPYSVGCSIVQPRSRFAAEATAPASPQLVNVQAPEVNNALGSAPDTAPRAQAASAPAILNRTAWPELPKEPATSGVAVLGSEAQSGNVQGALPLPPPQVSQLSNLTQKALNTLVGLEAASIRGGGFMYTHRDSGFVFEISPVEEDAEDAIMDGVEELAFNPIKMGLASKVLPGYLHEEIIFAATQKQKLVGRIMEALGTFTIRQARGANQLT
ncbi:g7081 [Coccomyxa elongata]